MTHEQAFQHPFLNYQIKLNWFESRYNITSPSQSPHAPEHTLRTYQRRTLRKFTWRTCWPLFYLQSTLSPWNQRTLKWNWPLGLQVGRVTPRIWILWTNRRTRCGQAGSKRSKSWNLQIFRGETWRSFPTVRPKNEQISGEKVPKEKNKKNNEHELMINVWVLSSWFLLMTTKIDDDILLEGETREP